MQNKLLELKQRSIGQITVAQNLEALTEIENSVLGRKAGELTELMKGLKDLTDEERKTVGQAMNETKQAIETALAEKKNILNSAGLNEKLTAEKIDLTAPALPKIEGGHFHPVTTVLRDLEKFFSSMGFMVAEGPELESDYFNFTAVNVPANHPARDMQDSFYLKDHVNSAGEASAKSAWVMRTQTSAVQVRLMREFGAPVRAIMPGRCYRNESTDARHEHTFYQLEGFAVDKNMTMSNMKAVLEAMVKYLFGAEIKLRLRPKFYPFVEPGVNGEVTCLLCGGVGCSVCKHTGWMEILGAGMVHPNVLKEGGVDPSVYRGFAFGFGLTRLVMLKYGIDDARLMMGNDLRFLKQF